MFIVPIFVTVLATAAIFALRRLTNNLKFTVHRDGQIDSTLKFQAAQLGLTLIVLVIIYLLNPVNFKTFFSVGEVFAPSSGINWLGIPPGMPWWEIAATMGMWITLATGLFMFFQLKKANARFSGLLPFIPWVILFSATNAFAEETIFRLGIVSPLSGQLSIPVIILLSGILFGIPHYFGMPKGLLGVLMAGFLGWLLAMSVVETQGMFLAWAVHFVQDVVIIASVFLIEASKNPSKV